MAVLPPDPVFCFKADMGHIHSLCFPKYTNSIQLTTQLIAATEDGWVYICDLETNRIQHKQNMGQSIQVVHSLNNDIIVQEKTGILTLWNVVDSAYLASKSFEFESGFCRSILVNNCLLVPQTNSTLDVVEVKTLEKVKRLEPGDEKVGTLMCIESFRVGEKDYILGGYETGDVILWDYTTTAKLHQLKLREQITSLAFDPVAGRGISGNSSNILEVFGISKDFKIFLKCEISVTNEGCNVVRLRPDRKIFVQGGWDGKLRVFSWKTLRVLVVLNEHKGAITDVQFSPSLVKYWSSNIFAASGADGRISLWNLYN